MGEMNSHELLMYICQCGHFTNAAIDLTILAGHMAMI